MNGASAARARANSAASIAARAIASAPSIWPGVFAASVSIRTSRCRAEVAELHMRIGIGEIGMRLRQPRGLDDPHRAAHLMRLALELAGEHRGRHQRRRQLDRFHRAFAREIAIDLFQFQRARGQQHAALAPVGRLVDQAGAIDCCRGSTARRSSRPWRSGIRAPHARPRSTTATALAPHPRSSRRTADRRRAALRRTARAGPSSRVSSRSAMARNARCAPSRSPSSCADCAVSSSASGSCAA